MIDQNLIDYFEKIGSLDCKTDLKEYLISSKPEVSLQVYYDNEYVDTICNDVLFTELQVLCKLGKIDRKKITIKDNYGDGSIIKLDENCIPDQAINNIKSDMVIYFFILSKSR